MNNQKKSDFVSHEFVRKPKRRQSPKHKNDHLYNFKCPHKENVNSKQKEEYHLNQNQILKNDSDIVLDLKHQLSHLKQEMAKIVNSKIQSAHTDNNISKLKMLDYYFPNKKDPNIPLTPNNSKASEVKTQGNQRSLEKQMASKLRSKERLKFSKLKRMQKFSPISSAKKKESESSSQKHIKSEQTLKDEDISRIKSIDESTLQEQLKKISMKNKKILEDKVISLVFDQQNVSNNIQKQKNKKQTKESSSSRHMKSKDVVSPRIMGSSEMKISKMRKQIQDLQLQIQSLKRALKQKEDIICGYLEQRQQIVSLRVSNRKQEIQIASLEQKILQGLEREEMMKEQNKQIIQQLERIKQQEHTTQSKFQEITLLFNTKQMQIISLQNNIKNKDQQIKNIQLQHLKTIQLTQKQFSTKENFFRQQIVKMNKLIQQIKYKQKSSLQTQPITVNNNPKSNKQELKPIPQSPSPKTSTIVSNRQKELLNVIKFHEKSIQNYQKDLSFLQSQCKNLHQFKFISKKQQMLLKETNKMLIDQQLRSLNAKYENNHLSFSAAKQKTKKGLK